MRCLKPIKVNGEYVNCGYCHACRINYTSMWTFRCLCELSEHNEASFITLTYDDDHLPNDYGLQPDDLQRFWKRLRQNLYYEYGDDTPKIRYYACGEYGDEEKKYFSPNATKPHGRPHYHAIVYGLDSWNEQHRQILKDSWTLCDPFRFDRRIGSNEHCGMEDVCREDIAYVCGYVQKKLSGEMAEVEYGDVIRPFSRCSRGIGLEFASKHIDEFAKGYIYLNKQKIAVPRYFRDKFGLEQKVLIRDDVKTKETYDKEIALLSDKFEKDMKKKGTWYPDNLSMMAIRFERWFNDYQWSLSAQVERDYLAKNKLKGRYL